MVLKRLLLTNFRQYEKLDLIFQDGVTGIVGRNGSGKSTILEAILWCLFGVRAARTSKEGIKRQSAPLDEPCRVDLDFELNGKTFSLTRSLSGKNHRSEAKLTQQGSLDAVSTREVDDYIVRLIGLDMKGFLSSFFARQKELNALFDARPADRKDHLARMLGVGRLDAAISLLKEDIKATRQKIDILSDLKIDPDQLEKEISQKSSLLTELGDGRENQTRSLVEIEGKISNQEADLDRLREIEHKFNRLEKKASTLNAQKTARNDQIGQLTAELARLTQISAELEPLKKQVEGLDTLQKELADLKEAATLSRERERLEKELADIANRLDENRKDLKSTGVSMAGLEKDLSGREGLQESITAAEADREKLRNEYTEIKAALGVIEGNLAELIKQKGDIRTLGPEATCRSCLRPFGDDYGKIEKHFDDEIRSLEKRREPMLKRLAEIKDRGREISGKLDEAGQKMESYAGMDRELASAGASLKALTTALAEAESRSKETADRLIEIGEVRFDASKLENLEQLLAEKLKKRDTYIRLSEQAARKPELEKSLEKAKNDLDNLETELNNLRAEIGAIDFKENEFQKTRADLIVNRDRAVKLKVEIERSKGQISLLNSEKATLVDRLDQYEKSRQEVGRLRESLTYMEKLSLMFADFRVYLIGRIRPALSRQTSQLFYEMTGGRYQEVVLDEDYSLRLYDRGESFPVNRFSGGEIDLVNLCFRLAISLEMSATAGIEHSFIILDEIFGSQDDQRQQMIIEGLGRLKNRFRQIIIISHITEVKEMVEHIINVELDSAGLSRVTAAETA